MKKITILAITFLCIGINTVTSVKAEDFIYQNQLLQNSAKNSKINLFGEKKKEGPIYVAESCAMEYDVCWQPGTPKRTCCAGLVCVPNGSYGSLCEKPQ